MELYNALIKHTNEFLLAKGSPKAWAIQSRQGMAGSRLGRACAPVGRRV